MLNDLTEEICECLRHAEECAREAAELPNGSSFRHDFLELQNRWLELARSIEVGKQLESTPKGLNRDRPHFKAHEARRVASNIAKLP
jgi:hypothetical protein